MTKTLSVHLRKMMSIAAGHPLDAYSVHGGLDLLARAELVRQVAEGDERWSLLAGDKPTQRIHDGQMIAPRKGLIDADLNPSSDPFREFFIGRNPE